MPLFFPSAENSKHALIASYLGQTSSLPVTKFVTLAKKIFKTRKIFTALYPGDLVPLHYNDFEVESYFPVVKICLPEMVVGYRETARLHLFEDTQDVPFGHVEPLRQVFRRPGGFTLNEQVQPLHRFEFLEKFHVPKYLCVEVEKPVQQAPHHAPVLCDDLRRSRQPLPEGQRLPNRTDQRVRQAAGNFVEKLPLLVFRWQ